MSRCAPAIHRDLINQIRQAARYESIAPRLDREALKNAVKAYFVPHESSLRGDFKPI